MDVMGILNRAIDTAIAHFKQAFSASLFRKFEALVGAAPKISAPVSAVLGLLIAVVLAIRTDSFVAFVSGFGWVLAVILSYYVGSKMQVMCAKTNDNNPLAFSSQEFLNVTTVLSLALAAAALIGGLYAAIKWSEAELFLYAIGAALFLVYTAWILNNPSLVALEIQPSATAGLEAIALFTLGNKIVLRSHKLIWGALTTVGAVLLLRTLYNSFGAPHELVRDGARGAVAAMMVIGGLLAPLVLYLAFVFAYLITDICRSILLTGTYAASALGSTGSSRAADSASQERVVGSVPESGEGPVAISPLAIKVIGISIAALVGLTLLASGASYGKRLFDEYRARSELERVENDRKKAEEEEKRARAAAERESRERLIAGAKRHVGKPAIDLVLDKEVNARFRTVFEGKLRDFENFFSDSGAVVEGDGLIVGQGCVKADCDRLKALAVVELETGRVYAVVATPRGVQFYGVAERDASPAAKKWAIANAER